MLGWRAKIGVLVPESNVAIEPEMCKMVPEGVTVHSARLPTGTTGGVMSSEEKMKRTFDFIIEHTEECAKRVAKAKVDVIAFGCTGASFYKGPNWANELARRIEKTSGVPSITTSLAALEALKEMEIKNVAVATPYIRWANELLVIFLQRNGISIVNIEELGLTTVDLISATPRQMVYSLVKKTDRENADGIFIPDTAFPTIEVIQPLEQDLGKPVVSANQATTWAALRRVNVHEPVQGYGRLLEEL